MLPKKLLISLCISIICGSAHGIGNNESTVEPDINKNENQTKSSPEMDHIITDPDLSNGTSHETNFRKKSVNNKIGAEFDEIFEKISSLIGKLEQRIEESSDITKGKTPINIQISINPDSIPDNNQVNHIKIEISGKEQMVLYNDSIGAKISKRNPTDTFYPSTRPKTNFRDSSQQYPHDSTFPSIDFKSFPEFKIYESDCSKKYKALVRLSWMGGRPTSGHMGMAFDGLKNVSKQIKNVQHYMRWLLKIGSSVYGPECYGLLKERLRKINESLKNTQGRRKFDFDKAVDEVDEKLDVIVDEMQDYMDDIYYKLSDFIDTLR